MGVERGLRSSGSLRDGSSKVGLSRELIPLTASGLHTCVNAPLRDNMLTEQGHFNGWSQVTHGTMTPQDTALSLTYAPPSTGAKW